MIGRPLLLGLAVAFRLLSGEALVFDATALGLDATALGLFGLLQSGVGLRLATFRFLEHVAAERRDACPQRSRVAVPRVDREDAVQGDVRVVEKRGDRPQVARARTTGDLRLRDGGARGFHGGAERALVLSRPIDASRQVPELIFDTTARIEGLGMGRVVLEDALERLPGEAIRLDGRLGLRRHAPGEDIGIGHLVAAALKEHVDALASLFVLLAAKRLRARDALRDRSLDPVRVFRRRPDPCRAGA